MKLNGKNSDLCVCVGLDRSLVDIGGVENKNPMVPTKKIELFTEYTGKYAEMNIRTPLKFIWPNKTHSNGSTMFKNTEYWMDGVLQ